MKKIKKEISTIESIETEIKKLRKIEYDRGYMDGSNAQAAMQGKYADLLESAEEIKGYNKYGKGIEINYCAVTMVIIILALVFTIITR